MYWSRWIPLFAVVMLLGYSIIYFIEWKHPRLKQIHHPHSINEWLKGCINIGITIFTGWLFASWLFFVSFYFKGIFGFITDNIWLQRLYSFLFLDLIVYAWHRINHIYPSLWKYHVFHHEEKELNVFSTFHFHPKEILISTIWRAILLPLMGIDPAALLLYNAVFFAVILFHHSNYKISYRWDKILQHIIVSPGLHHLHHSVKMIESNSNYGSVFSFWDKVFGSFTKYHQQKIEYGIDHKAADM